MGRLPRGAANAQRKLSIAWLYFSVALVALFGVPALALVIYDSVIMRTSVLGPLLSAVAFFLATSWIVALRVYGLRKRSSAVGSYSLVMVSAMASLLVAFIPMLTLFKWPVRDILAAILNVWAAALVATVEAHLLYNARQGMINVDPEELEFRPIGDPI
ncbi:hypothetical protein F5B18DRAFT_670777 [Nemania serpens]|nr:hypothetical protein F5B18DRAFT_670777 [Nemania serpens]